MSKNVTITCNVCRQEPIMEALVRAELIIETCPLCPHKYHGSHDAFKKADIFQKIEIDSLRLPTIGSIVTSSLPGDVSERFGNWEVVEIGNKSMNADRGWVVTIQKLGQQTEGLIPIQHG
ncbi:hypothetical protein ACFFJX_08280 [Pseudarcicella hirudinis]|uniref:hypothetical protein n=1 Tax=Pseudarcicella hirudinis TaxID=1079859 RepID=UPI0035ED1289